MKRTAIWMTALFSAAIFLAASRARLNTSGPGSAPEDSVAVIKRFMTASGSDGLLYQYIVTYSFRRGQKDSTASDTTSVVLCDNHNIRSNLGTMGMQVIGHGDLPGYSLILYPENKTYALHVIDTVGGRGTYTVAKVGNETVQGYHCVHARVTTSYGRGTGLTQDLWLSTDVPGYAMFKKMASMQQVTPKMIAALDQAGCTGMFVKTQMQTPTFSMSMVLASVGRKSFPGSMFQIPPGYTQAAGRRH